MVNENEEKNKEDNMDRFYEHVWNSLIKIRAQNEEEIEVLRSIAKGLYNIEKILRKEFGIDIEDLRHML